MKDYLAPQSPYEKKLDLILTQMLSRFDGNHTPDEYELELAVAKRYLDALGVKP